MNAENLEDVLHNEDVLQANNSNYGILVSMAMPIISLANKLKEIHLVPNKAILKSMLINRVESFLREVQSKAYGEKELAIARYVLCAFIDESVLNASWGMALGWQNDGMSKHFACDNYGKKKFFEILKELYAEPKKNLELLELFYLCLNFGFSGEYFAPNRKKVMLQEITSELNECLMRYRNMAATSSALTEADELLVKAIYDNDTPRGAVFNTPKKFFSRRLFLVLSFGVFIGLSVYATLDLRLNRIAAPLYKIVAVR